MNKIFEVGIDEVGKGAIFGPVFSAVVVLDEKNKFVLENWELLIVKNYPLVKENYFYQKFYYFPQIMELVNPQPREIDKLGIRVATELSMIRALRKLKEKPTELKLMAHYY